MQGQQTACCCSTSLSAFAGSIYMSNSKIEELSLAGAFLAAENANLDLPRRPGTLGMSFLPPRPPGECALRPRPLNNQEAATT